MDTQPSSSPKQFATAPAQPHLRLRGGTSSGRAALVRLLAAISLLAVGGVHIQQYIVDDYRVIPTIGPLFLLNFIGGTVLGLYFLIPAGRQAGRIRLIVDAVAELAGWFLAAGALVALLVSEHTPLFGFMEHGYRFAIVFAIVSEAVAIVALTILIVDSRVTSRRKQGSALA